MIQNKKINKLITLLLVFVMGISLAACGKNDAVSEEAKKASKEFVYRGEVLNFDVAAENIARTFSANNRIYFHTTLYTETGVTNEIVSFDFDGSNKQTIPLVFSANSNANGFGVDAEGNVYALVTEYIEDSSDPENYVYKENYFLIKYSGTGEELWRVDLAALNTTEDYFYVNNLVVSGDKLMVVTSLGMFIYDKDSNMVQKLENADGNMGNIYTLKDGKVMVSEYSETGETFRELDLNTGKTSEEPIKIPGMNYNYSYYQGYSHDLYLADGYGVYGFNFGDTELTKLMSFIDSDIDTSYLNNIIGLSDTEFIASYNDNLTYETIFMKFTKVPPEEVVEKDVITIACYYLDSTVRSRVVEFNKTNPDYRISITDYSTFDTMDDYTAGITKLNADIAAGNVPDIMVINNQLPVNSYIEKGLFEDLNPYIEKDEELDKNDYFANILDAFSTDGKMYQLVPSFNVLSVVGKTADVGATPGWTLEDLNKLVASKGPDVVTFPEVTRMSMLYNSIQMSSSQFINWQTGECTFNTKGFTDLLEYLKDFPEEIDYAIYEKEGYWENYETMYREGRALLAVTYLSDFATFNYQKKGTFGEDITFIGFPAENKNGSAINYSLNFALSAKSKHKDAAWDFIRYYLTDEYQETITYNFPISKEHVAKLAETAKQKPFYLDENGNKVEYDQTYYLNGVEIVIDPITDAEIEQVMNLLESVNQVVAYDESLINIITEEAESFFSGQKSAADVAAIIQSRVQIYVSENL